MHNGQPKQLVLEVQNALSDEDECDYVPEWNPEAFQTSLEGQTRSS